MPVQRAAPLRPCCPPAGACKGQSISLGNACGFLPPGALELLITALILQSLWTTAWGGGRTGQEGGDTQAPQPDGLEATPRKAAGEARTAGRRTPPSTIRQIRFCSRHLQVSMSADANFPVAPKWIRMNLPYTDTEGCECSLDVGQRDLSSNPPLVCDADLGVVV